MPSVGGRRHDDNMKKYVQGYIIDFVSKLR
jgi:hypothetical protein